MREGTPLPGSRLLEPRLAVIASILLGIFAALLPAAATLARPGANVTGLSDESIQLSSKRMELLKEAMPKARLIAILGTKPITE